ncbi:MAG: peptidylprolyl isomerase, partial [Planctomycetes bacterium]|nr:peptidylprolyl isomerase [Planctomycetota bacterium]
NSGYYIVRRLTDEEIKKDNPANFPAANEQVQAMRDDAKALMERPEHHASRVKVQHILIARYMSDANGKMKMLQPAEAEELAAKVYELAKQADGKEAFDDLVRKYTYDDSKGDTPGEYLIVADEEDALPPQRARKGFVRSFGDVAWRLKVGEVGIAMYDSAKSNYGYHIIKRIE